MLASRDMSQRKTAIVSLSLITSSRDAIDEVVEKLNAQDSLSRASRSSVVQWCIDHALPELSKRYIQKDSQ